MSAKRAEKIGEATINGKTVSFFSSPHSEPDFPWVDVYELARAFVPKPRAREIVEMTKSYGGGKPAAVTARNGSKVSLIMCHAMAHGLMAVVDHGNGHISEDEGGPAHTAYSRAAANVANEKMNMSFEDMIHAFHNPGGPVMRAVLDNIIPQA